MGQPSTDELSWLYRVAVALTLDEAAGKQLVVRALRAYPEPARASEGRLLAAMRDAAQTEVVGTRCFGADVVEPPSPFVVASGLQPEVRDVLVLVHCVGVRAETAVAAVGADVGDASRVLAAAEEALLAKLRDASDDGSADATGTSVVSVLAPWRRAFGELRLSSDDPALAEALRATASRRRRVAAIGLFGLALFVGAMAFVVGDLLGWDERQEALLQFSNPLPTELSPENVAPGNRPPIPAGAVR